MVRSDDRRTVTLLSAVSLRDAELVAAVLDTFELRASTDPRREPTGVVR